MQLGRIQILRGPNRWAGVPVAEAEVASGDPAELLRRVREFQVQSGFAGSFAAVDGNRLAFDFDEPPLARACLELAATPGVEFADVQARLRKIALDARLGPSTGGIVAAAVRRGIPTRRLNDGSLVQLGWGAKQKRIWTAETDDTPTVAEVIAQDKQLTRQLLAALGVAAPWGRPVHDADDAWHVAQQCVPPVVVKPRFGNQGRGVATNLMTREQVEAAFAAARREGEVVVETFAPGRDFRVLVVGGKVVAASQRDPAQVVGDGTSTIRDLIAVANRDPRRSDGHSTSLSYIKIDAVAEAVLAEQGFTADSVPAASVRVLIRRNANLSTGGTATDVTDLVHPEVAADAIAAARAVGLDVAGIDIVCEDISQPLGPQRGAIVEVNAGPGLRMHLEPSAGKPRDVGAAVVDALFPNGESGRIPVVAVVGTGVREVAARLARGGRFVGTASSDGIWLGTRHTDSRPAANVDSVQSVLLHPRVEAVAFEVTEAGFLAEGLALDRCDLVLAPKDHPVAEALGRLGFPVATDIEAVHRLA